MPYRFIKEPWEKDDSEFLHSEVKKLYLMLVKLGFQVTAMFPEHMAKEVGMSVARFKKIRNNLVDKGYATVYETAHPDDRRRTGPDLVVLHTSPEEADYFRKHYLPKEEEHVKRL